MKIQSAIKRMRNLFWLEMPKKKKKETLSDVVINKGLRQALRCVEKKLCRRATKNNERWITNTRFFLQISADNKSNPSIVSQPTTIRAGSTF